jgi:small-conductance mechanosensitive channel
LHVYKLHVHGKANAFLVVKKQGYGRYDMNILWRIFLSILILLIALACGLFFRRKVAQWLKKIRLINILAQAVGVFVIFLVLMLALAAVSVVLTGNPGLLVSILEVLEDPQNPLHGLANTVWNIMISIILLVIGIGIAETFREAITLRWKNHASANIRTLVGRAVYTAVLTIFFFVILSLWNIQIGLPVAVVTGIITFALQDLIKNLVAGVYLLGERPFEIGDLVTVSPHTGEVKDISMRATTLRLATGEEMIVPNALLFDGIVTNQSSYKERQAIINALFSEEAYVEKETRQQLIQAIKEVVLVKNYPEPSITLNATTGRTEGTSSMPNGSKGRTVSLEIRFWVANNDPEAVTAVMEVLRKKFPQADFTVHEFAGNSYSDVQKS